MALVLAVRNLCGGFSCGRNSSLEEWGDQNLTFFQVVLMVFWVNIKTILLYCKCGAVKMQQSSCVRKDTVDIENLVTFRNGDRKMQSIRVRSRRPSRIRKWNQLSLFRNIYQSNIYGKKLSWLHFERNFIERIKAPIFLKVVLVIEIMKEPQSNFKEIFSPIILKDVFSSRTDYPFSHQQHQCYQTGQAKPIEFLQH